MNDCVKINNTMKTAEEMMYACGTYYCFESTWDGLGTDIPSQCCIKYWVESLPGGMGSQEEQFFEIPTSLILKTADEIRRRIGESH
jgi:hypothetical protein